MKVKHRLTPHGASVLLFVEAFYDSDKKIFLMIDCEEKRFDGQFSLDAANTCVVHLAIQSLKS